MATTTKVRSTRAQKIAEAQAVDPAQKGEALKEVIRIKAPSFETALVTIQGTSPLVQHKFSAKAVQQIRETQQAGQQARGKRVRQPKDFEQVYRDAIHVSTEGWHGFAAPALRNACISVCKLVGYKMTHAKLSVFIEADGYDATDGTPLVRIKGKPEKHESYARNDNGSVDLRWRPMWREWSAQIRIRWDTDQFSAADIMSLLARAGAQVGIGEGRYDSPKSNGLGWGCFEIIP